MEGLEFCSPKSGNTLSKWLQKNEERKLVELGIQDVQSVPSKDVFLASLSEFRAKKEARAHQCPWLYHLACSSTEVVRTGVIFCLKSNCNLVSHVSMQSLPVSQDGTVLTYGLFMIICGTSRIILDTYSPRLHSLVLDLTHVWNLSLVSFSIVTGPFQSWGMIKV